MLAFAILAVAVAHDPCPDDVHRFGFTVEPLAASLPRLAWDDSRSRLYELCQPVSGWHAYGREHLIQAELADARWRERVWDAVDDLGRSCASGECRHAAAKRLRRLIGPVAYWLGALPDPVP